MTMPFPLNAGTSIHKYATTLPPPFPLQPASLPTRPHTANSLACVHCSQDLLMPHSPLLGPRNAGTDHARELLLANAE